MSYNDLEKNISYKFKNIELLDQALTHKSYDNKLNNERLEFLGDSLLNAVVSQYLYQRFSYEKEGLLTRMRAQLVKAETLTQKAEDLGLQEHIKLSKGTANLSKDRKNSILEDAFEAVIGAIFIDSGWDITNSTILNLFKKELGALSSDMTFKDSKTELQEYLQSIKLNPPDYVIKDLGKDGFNCSINFKNNIFNSTGTSKRSAETKAASLVLKFIKENNE
ncbi:MAG: ribonuclease III [Gammaproteobacteria bacterium]|nr:ribonuclease III [Gammaproteobacteria bacterium]